MFSRATNFPLQEGKEKAAVNIVNASGSQKSKWPETTLRKQGADVVSPMFYIFRGPASATQTLWSLPTPAFNQVLEQEHRENSWDTA